MMYNMMTRNTLKFFAIVGFCAILLAAGVVDAVVDYRKSLETSAPPPPTAPVLYWNRTVQAPIDNFEWIMTRGDDLKFSFTHNTIRSGSETVVVFPACDVDAQGKIVENDKCRYAK